MEAQVPTATPAYFPGVELKHHVVALFSLAGALTGALVLWVGALFVISMVINLLFVSPSPD